MYLKLKLKFDCTSSWLSVCVQAPGAGGVGAEEQEAEGEAPPVSVPGPDVLGEPGRAAGHRQADRRDREEGQRPADLHQRSRDQSHHHECVTRKVTAVNGLMWPHWPSFIRHWSFYSLTFSKWLWIKTSVTHNVICANYLISICITRA